MSAERARTGNSACEERTSGTNSHEVPFDARIIPERVDVHAKCADKERQWQEKECDPAETP